MTDILICSLFFFTLVEAVILSVMFYKLIKITKQVKRICSFQKKQSVLLETIEKNTKKEKTQIERLNNRKNELTLLEEKIRGSVENFEKIFSLAKGITRSSKFLRDTILKLAEKGFSYNKISKETGIVIDEIQIILSSTVQGK